MKVLNEFGNTSLQMAADINIKKKLKAIAETGEIAKKALEAEEAAKRRAQLEAAEATRLAQEEIERKKKEEEATIKARRDAVAAEEAFSQLLNQLCYHIRMLTLISVESYKFLII